MERIGTACESVCHGRPHSRGGAFRKIMGNTGKRKETGRSEKGEEMITVNLRYTGINGNARKFAEEMMSSGTADKIRAEEGNLRYEYYYSLEDPETVLLIDSWCDQAAIDAHHASPMMEIITNLREKYDLHMTVERFMGIEENEEDRRFIRK